jgi:Mg-chelatase subunit ChlD
VLNASNSPKGAKPEREALVRPLAAGKRLCFNASVKTSACTRLLLVSAACSAAAISAWACADPVKVPIGQSSNNFLEEGESEGETLLLDDSCVNQTSAAEQRLVALYVMLDSSGSMEEPTGTGPTKWQAVQRAIRSFLRETVAGDLSIGLQFFPLPKPGASFTCTQHSDCGPDGPDGKPIGGLCFLSTCSQGDTITLCRDSGDCPGTPSTNPCVDFGLCSNSDEARPLACVLGSGTTRCEGDLGTCEDFERTCTDATLCDPSGYATPAVEIGLVSERFAAIDRALTAQPPQGLTPTAPALQGAVDHAREWGLTHPDHTVVAVLATDGQPSRCAPQEELAVPDEAPPIEEVLQIASAALNDKVPIRTFAIGVFQAGDTSINNVNAIARAGGTQEAVLIDTNGEVEGQFLEALRAIRTGTLACQFQLPESAVALDYFRVNLQFNSGTQRLQLPYVTNEARCVDSPNGWHYDVDPNTNQPSAIQVCPGACEQFKAATTGSINLQLGCETIIR